VTKEMVLAKVIFSAYRVFFKDRLPDISIIEEWKGLSGLNHVVYIIYPKDISLFVESVHPMKSMKRPIGKVELYKEENYCVYFAFPVSGDEKAEIFLYEIIENI